jgi:hypothetical protein
VIVATAPATAALLHVQELQDGSWVGNAAWGGRTLTDGATEAHLVIHRLAARIAAMPEAGPLGNLKLTCVPLGDRRATGDPVSP